MNESHEDHGPDRHHDHGATHSLSVDHEAHASPGHDDVATAHAGHGNAGHGNHVTQFRDRFWVSLVLAVPVVVFSEMLGHLLGYEPPTFPGSALVSPVIGTVIFF